MAGRKRPTPAKRPGLRIVTCSNELCFMLIQAYDEVCPYCGRPNTHFQEVQDGQADEGSA